MISLSRFKIEILFWILLKKISRPRELVLKESGTPKTEATSMKSTVMAFTSWLIMMVVIALFLVLVIGIHIMCFRGLMIFLEKILQIACLKLP